MLIPLINLTIKNNKKFENYNKTILLDLHTLSLILDDTANIENCNVCFTYEILKPIKMPKNTTLKYDDMCYVKELFVPIFLENDNKKRERYIYGGEKLIDLVKYPAINEIDKYRVEELSITTFAGTTNNKDTIYLSISFYNGFPETKETNDLIMAKARNKIKNNNTNSIIDNKINQINKNRQSLSLDKIEYRYHILDGKSYLMDLNLIDLINKNQNRYTSKEEREIIDLSFFDFISTNLNSSIIINKTYLLKSNLSIKLNEKQLERLMEIKFSKKTWQSYLTKGIFIE